MQVLIISLFIYIMIFISIHSIYLIILNINGIIYFSNIEVDIKILYIFIQIITLNLRQKWSREKIVQCKPKKMKNGKDHWSRIYMKNIKSTNILINYILNILNS